MIHRVISTDSAPSAIGLYSQAVKAGNFVFCSGQIPIDPKTGKLIDGDIKTQTIQVFENLKAILEAGGLTLDHIVKTSVYLANLDDYPAINKVYQKYFPENPPARAAVEVSSLPKGARLEIEAIACV